MLKKGNQTNEEEQTLYYKFDDQHFLKEADFLTTFKVPLKDKNLENIENKTEPIYKAIAIINAQKFYKVIDFLLSESN
jgi:hypothetical protein